MPKSGWLPDVSSVFAYWRTKYIEAMNSKSWDEASLSLHNMNGALDTDYRLPISDEEWNKQNDGYVVWKCNECTTTQKKVMNEGEDNEYIKEIQVPTTSRREDIKVFEERSSQVVQILSGEKTRKMWTCPKCGNVDSVKHVKSEMIRYQTPHFRGCIYSEPQRPLTGLERRRGEYPQYMRKWARNYSMELEHRLAVYRLEYIKQNGHDMEDSGYQDKGDK